MPNNRVIHFEIQADDVERAKEFYRKTFGWKIENWMSADKGGMDYWGLITGDPDKPGINGGLYKRPEERKIYTFDCTIQVGDLDAVIEEVEKNGGVIRQGKMQIAGVGWFAGCADTEGNYFGLMQSTGGEGVAMGEGEPKEAVSSPMRGGVPGDNKDGDKTDDNDE